MKGELGNMKWIDGLTEKEKDRIYSENYYERDRRRHMWRKWFAWFPVEIGETDDGVRKIKVWLQYVERKIESKYACEVWCYREIEK